ncbi:hypothetical protein JVU11DRAFT_11357 [Chiua virens]|nr:hypothetical protein JVU11DRAFT_11357 [Chiua virens]
MTSELKTIILYDIPCITPGRPWSPNTMKTRYSLGYKGLPFTTVWVEFPDISALLQSKGIDQGPYTLPAIEDPNTGAVIVDSLAIATYLDETYPETPKLMSPAARALMEHAGNVLSLSFGSQGGRRPGSSQSTAASLNAAGTPGDTSTNETDNANSRELAPRLVFLVLASQRLNSVSKAYYHKTRAKWLGDVWTTLISACSDSAEERTERVRQGVEAIRGVIAKVTALYERGPIRDGSDVVSEGPSMFLLGEEPCFLDFAVASRVQFVLDGLTPSEVEEFKVLEGGRLVRLVESLAKYYKFQV